MNMAAMGGPVGGGAAGAQMHLGTPNSINQQVFTPEYVLKKLNTAIYDYLLRNSQYDIARSFQEKMPIDPKTDTKESPSQRGLQMNGVDDSMDDSKDNAILKRPEDLPLPNNFTDGPFLQDWWCQFWEIWHGQRNKGRTGTNAYLGPQRAAQKGRFNMMGAIDPNMQRGYNMMQMQGMNNGMAMGPNDLRKSAMQQNNQQRQM